MHICRIPATECSFQYFCSAIWDFIYYAKFLCKTSVFSSNKGVSDPFLFTFVSLISFNIMFSMWRQIPAKNLNIKEQRLSLAAPLSSWPTGLEPISDMKPTPTLPLPLTSPPTPNGPYWTLSDPNWYQDHETVGQWKTNAPSRRQLRFIRCT